MKSTLCNFLASVFWIAGFGSLAAAEKPNVVFILADDLGYGEVGCYGQKKIPTPNIDRLAEQGTRFTRHYSGAPVCAPARCVLLSGKHLGHAEIRGNLQASVQFPQFKEGQQPISDGVKTLAEVFHDAGYATGAIGKWGLGPVGSSGDPNRQGFDLFYGYNCQAVAHSYYPRYLWRNDKQEEINPHPIPGHKRKPTGEVKLQDYQGKNYAPYLMMDEAEKFIAKNKSKPFFLYLAFVEPHVSIQAPAAAVDRFPKEWDDEAYRGQCDYLPTPRPRAGYAAMIDDLDRYVGRVMAALEKAGVADHTIVVFTSDNGTTHPGKPNTHFHIGGVDAEFFNSTLDLKGWKGSVYEGGLRVPMIVRYPGKVAAGATSAAPGYFADWFPTLCDAASLKKPAGLDGSSLWPVITGGNGGPRKPMVWIYPEYGGQVAVAIGDMMVMKRGLRTRKPLDWEVYDVVKDRAETKNLAKDHPELIQQALEILKQQNSPNANFPLELPTS